MFQNHFLIFSVYSNTVLYENRMRNMAFKTGTSLWSHIKLEAEPTEPDASLEPIWHLLPLRPRPVTEDKQYVS